MSRPSLQDGSPPVDPGVENIRHRGDGTLRRLAKWCSVVSRFPLRNLYNWAVRTRIVR